MHMREDSPHSRDSLLARVFKGWAKPQPVTRVETPPKDGKWAPFMREAIAELSTATGCLRSDPSTIEVETVATLLQHAERALRVLEKGARKCPNTSKTVQGVIDSLAAIGDMRPEDPSELADAAYDMGDMLRDQRRILCQICTDVPRDQVAPMMIRFIVRGRELFRALNHPDLAEDRMDQIQRRAEANLRGLSPCLDGDVREAVNFLAAIRDAEDPAKVKRLVKAMARHFGDEHGKTLPEEWR